MNQHDKKENQNQSIKDPSNKDPSIKDPSSKDHSDKNPSSNQPNPNTKPGMKEDDDKVSIDKKGTTTSGNNKS